MMKKIFKDLLWAALAIVVVGFVIAFLLRLAGVTESLSFWWGIFATLLLPPILVYGVLQGHYSSLNHLHLGLITGLIYVVLLVAVWPMVVGHIYDTAPFSAEATKERGIDTDVTTADGIRPSGTGLRIAAARNRGQLEAEITKSAAAELDRIAKDTSLSTERRAALARQVVINQQRNLEAVRRIKIDEPPPPQTVRWYESVHWPTALLRLLVFALVGAAIFVAIRSKGKSISSLVWALVIIIVVTWWTNGTLALTSSSAASTGSSYNAGSLPGHSTASDSTVIFSGRDTPALGILNPGQTLTLTYAGSGRIVSNNENGWSSPLCGTPLSETAPQWKQGLPYAHEGMNTDAVYLQLQGGTHQALSCGSSSASVTNTTTTPQQVTLHLHDSRLWENEGDATFTYTIH